MLPQVILHNAVSVDGRMDFIQPDLGQFYELIKRWREDATLAGSETVLAAEAPPEDVLDFNPPPPRANDTRPLLVIPDSRGRVKTWHHLRKQSYWRGMVALVTKSTPKNYIEYLKKRSIDYIFAGKEQVDFREALEELNLRYKVDIVRVDSGGTLNGVLLRAGLVSELSLVIYPGLVGGLSPRSFFKAGDLTAAEDVIPLKLAHAEDLGNDAVWLRYKVLKTAAQDAGNTLPD
jgi:2,5-diamino-6-(ribosylamino)-4(3H)-pyrimidinone 5'-phosphate reductase